MKSKLVDADTILHAKVSREFLATLWGLSPWYAPFLSEKEQNLLYSMISRNTVAKLFGVTPQRISQLVSRRLLCHDGNGRFMLWQVYTDYARQLESHGTPGRKLGT